MYDPNDPFNLKPIWTNINAPEVEEPLPSLPNPDPTNQKFLQEAYGINTRGPMADQAAMNAQNFQPMPQPQQFGQNLSLTEGEGPLTPQQTAEAMPATSDAMDKLIKQHMLGMPKAPQASREGIRNSRTADAEAKAAREQQAQLNRASAREKTQDAWSKTLLLNGLQGAGPMAGGGQTSFSGGPRVERIGGYGFVGGTWRTMGADEQAKVDQTRANTDAMRQRPIIDREEIASRERIAVDNARARASENEADRILRGRSLDETKRHHESVENRLTAQGQDRVAAEQEKIAQETLREFHDLVAKMREREGIADEQVKSGTRSYVNPKRILPDALVGPNVPERNPFLDDSRNAKGGFTRSSGSYETMGSRALTLAEQLEKMHLAGVNVGDMPEDIIDFINGLRASRGREVKPSVRGFD